MARGCDAGRWLYPSIGRLECDREHGHEGMHRDNDENLYWFPGAPKLEFVMLTQPSDPSDGGVSDVANGP